MQAYFPMQKLAKALKGAWMLGLRRNKRAAWTQTWTQAPHVTSAGAA